MDIRCFLKAVFLLLALNFAGLNAVFAAEPIQNMYEATVPLANRSDAARREAIIKGLEQVLVRYTGYSGVGRLAGASGALSSAESYVIEFAVEARQVPAEDGLSTEKAEALWVRYNASKVDDLVDRQQLPIWSSLRPTVRYLVVQELWEAPTLMSAENYPAMTATLDTLFSERGFPASIYDSPDLDAKNIWHMSEVDAHAVFQNSGAELLVMVRVLDANEFGSSAEVLVVQGSGLSVYREQSGSAITDVTQALNKFVDSYSVDYAFLGGSGQAADIYVSVVGLNGFGAYRRFLDLVSDVEQVTAARLEAFKNEQMLFRVSYGSNQERLVSALVEQAGLTQVSSEYNALGTRESPLVLSTPSYQPTEAIEPIFARPPIVLPVVPINASEPTGELLED